MSTKVQIGVFYIVCAAVVGAVWTIAYLPPAGVTGEITMLRIANYASRWQTLIASGVALLAAYTAYEAAMSKVRSEERHSQRAESRQLRGVLLRLDYTVHATAHEAVAYLNAINTAATTEDKIQEIENIEFVERASTDEAWKAIDILKPALAHALFNVRIGFHNVADSRDHLLGKQHIKPTDMSKRKMVGIVVESLKHIAMYSGEIREAINLELAATNE